MTLCGVSVASIGSQSSTQVVVTAGQAAGAGIGDVVVYSTSYGTTTKANSYGFNNGVYAIATDTNGMVYFAGTFTNAVTPSGNVPVKYVAQFDGTNITQMGNGFGNGVYALEFDREGTLYAGGGFFEFSGGYYMSRIAKWTGNAWTNVGDGLGGGTIHSMAFDEDNDLYVGGQFNTLWGSRPAQNMAVKGTVKSGFKCCYTYSLS